MRKGAWIVIPVLMVVEGVAQLLNVRGFVPGVDWAWTLGLTAVGLLTLAVGGLNKVTVVVGPFLVIASIFSMMRQTGRLPVNVEAPCLTIVLGLLLFLSACSRLPTPDWMRAEDGTP